MKSFKQFIVEANYGALQTDRRITELRDKLIKKLVDAWMRDHNTEVRVTALTYRESMHQDYETTLKIVRDTPSDEVPDHMIFYSGLTAQRQWRQGENIIVITIKSDVDYTEAIKRVAEIKPLLSHEIKHAMDNNDQRFGNNSMVSYIKHDGTNYKQYVTQIQEINNFLITVIEDLDLIRKQNPEISFSDALKQSWWWNHILQVALYDYGKLTKFKSKLAQFWTHEKVVTGRIDHSKELRLRLMLLLYQWHKDGDVKKIKDMGKRPVDVLSKNIERMDDQKLRDTITHFKKLIDERNA